MTRAKCKTCRGNTELLEEETQNLLLLPDNDSCLSLSACYTPGTTFSLCRALSVPQVKSLKFREVLDDLWHVARGRGTMGTGPRPSDVKGGAPDHCPALPLGQALGQALLRESGLGVASGISFPLSRSQFRHHLKMRLCQAIPFPSSSQFLFCNNVS